METLISNIVSSQIQKHYIRPDDIRSVPMLVVFMPDIYDLKMPRHDINILLQHAF